MDKWIVVAVDQHTAASLCELLARHLECILPLRSEQAKQEFLWGAHLILCLSPMEDQPKTVTAAQTLMDYLSGEYPSDISADLRRSLRLKWPIASAWIEAQWSAGRLERAPQDGDPGDDSES